MSLITRIANVFRSGRTTRDIDDELQSHIDEAIAQGRDPIEARRAFGNALKLREDSRDIRIAARLDSIKADLTFGLRQLLKNKVTATAAIFSLALAIGACTSAFRLIDALLLRPLPIAHPERLHVLNYEFLGQDGEKSDADSLNYPLYRTLREAAKDSAELLAISYARRTDITYGGDSDMEKASLQFISGNTFPAFGLRPAHGRLISPDDDRTPGAHPVAVISHDYWTSRFARDPKVLGRTFRQGNELYQIIGVTPERFTGTDPGTLTDVFIPTMMNAKAINNQHWQWFRTWIHFEPGVTAQQLRDKLQPVFNADRAELAKEVGPRLTKEQLDHFLSPPLSVRPAAAGFSGLQKDYRRSLYILGAMVVLILLIACVNVANLMLAQATARARELALRVSIGAGRSRLIQLMLAESAIIAAAASLLGSLFAWRAAPFVVSLISSPDNPTRLILPVDWRVTAFGIALTLAVTLLFGAVPAFRASTVQPVAALKGGEEIHTRHRVMHALVAAQVAFCFVVYFLAGMFVYSFDRLSKQPLGFQADNLLILDTAAKSPQPLARWSEVVDRLKTQHNVESAAYTTWPLMGYSMWSTDVWINGRQMHSMNPYLLAVSPEWADTMRIQIINGRNFRPGDKAPDVALVSESYARQYLDGRDPVGTQFERMVEKNKRVATTVIGVFRDVRYADMRQAIRPVIFYPVTDSDSDAPLAPESWGTIILRTEGDPLALASAMRQEVPRIRSEFRVSNIRTQRELVDSHTVRERLLAMLSIFFGAVALILAAVGLYGVLTYSVLQRRREIGIRLALGAKPAHLARRVTARIAAMLLTGSIIGIGLGFASEQYIETLLYDVRARDLATIAIPAITIAVVAMLAATPPVLKAIRTDPATALRTD